MNVSTIAVSTNEPVSLAPSNELLEIRQNVATILKTIKGSVPLDRDLGVDFSPLDSPENQSLALWRLAVIEAIERDEPRVKVKSVTLDQDKSDVAEGKLTPIVTLEVVTND